MPQIAGLMAMSAVAGIVGTASSGFVMDRFGATWVLPVYLAGAAAAITVIATMDLDSVWTPLAFAALGFLYNSGWGALNALCSIMYPPEMRATGVACSIGAGKVGGMIGPVIGGVLIAAQWDLTPILLIAAVPEFVAAAAVLVLFMLRRTQPVPAPAV
ncbi:MFS transporter [Paraburkholderia caffeinilytica]|uniref:Major facilitator superfamily (MFS) profile domain-containing protein n=1 Tax=Paraburkholderia caffeinilytica TaxID=1761016 RepID=A0ABQ1LMU2_9BURK|nr:MFS transporter [Paraburkholderia caffeinilytica]GGC26928.1 hypothetical protein GCM10011400_11600 [Paraburkholderia caffeinilytica]